MVFFFVPLGFFLETIHLHTSPVDRPTLGEVESQPLVLRKYVLHCSSVQYGTVVLSVQYEYVLELHITGTVEGLKIDGL